MSNLYLKHILEHSKAPHNQGVLNPCSGKSEKYNPLCGDKISVTLKVKNNIIEDIKFMGEGCAISQAAMSMLTDEFKGKSIEYAKNFSKEDIIDMLGIELSPTRLKCAILGRDAVISALEN